MATAREVQVDTETHEVSLQLTVHDADLATFLDEFDEPERAEVLEKAILVGARTLELSETTKDVEHVKREFEAMQSEFEQEIDAVQEEIEATFGDDGELADALEDYLGEEGRMRERIEEAFGKDGELTERLDEVLGEDGSKIQEALDPAEEGTPLYRLKTEIHELRDEIVREEGREEERQQSWKKGTDFEETVGNLLEDVVYQTTHDVEHTGDEDGEIPGSKVGDYVLTVGDTGQDIVVEAKSEKGYSARDIKDEMDEAIENRDADYGIFVVESESYVPDKVGYFQEYDQQMLCVALSADDDDEIDPGFLRIAWNWARMRTVQSHVETGEDLDAETIQAKVEEVRGSIENVSTAKSKCTEMQDTAQDIKSLLDEIREDVTTDLDDIVSELSRASDS